MFSLRHRRFAGQCQLGICALSSLGLSACLQLNPDYRHRSLGEVTQGLDQGRAENSTSPANLSGQLSGSLSSDTKSSSDRGTANSDSLSTTIADSSSTPQSNSASTTSTGVEPPLPANWTPIEVNGGRLIRDLVAGYSLKLLFDHQSLVALGAASDGSDLAIVSRRGGVTTSLGRVLDPQSSWDRPDTKLWFAIDQTLLQGSIIDDEYFLVLNDANHPPNLDSSGVFLDFEDFDNSAPDPARWTEIHSSEGSNKLTNNIEGVLLTASPHISYQLSYVTLRKSAMDFPSGIRIDARTQFHTIGLSGNCGRIFPISLTSENNFTLRAGLRSDLSEYAGLSFNQNTGVNEVTPINAITPQNSRWDLHSLSWIDSSIGYWRNGNRVLETQSLGSIVRPDQTPLHLELSAGARKNGCIGIGQLGLEVDWIRIRHYAYPEPTTRLKQ